MSHLPELPPIRSILVASDLSPASLPAAETAAVLAKACGAKLRMIHALPENFDPRLDFLQEGIADKLQKDTEKELRTLADRLPDGAETQVEVAVKPGNAIDVILREVKEAKADLLVVGTHGRTGLTHLALGSVAEHLASTAPADVLLVRARPQRLFQRPLLALNPTRAAYRAASRAVEVARLCEVGKLTVAAAYSLPIGFAEYSRPEDEIMEQVRDFLREDLRPVVQELRDEGLEVDVHLDRGHASDVVLAAAAEHDCDLVFLGSHNRPRWTSMLLGDTSRVIAHRFPYASWLVRDLPEKHPVLSALAKDLGLG